MARVLYDDKKLIGEVLEWTQRSDPPAYKTFLGKTVLMTPANVECSFVSPKPVNRRSKLTIVEDKNKRLILDIVKVIGGTNVIAKIREEVAI